MTNNALNWNRLQHWQDKFDAVLTRIRDERDAWFHAILALHFGENYAHKFDITEALKIDEFVSTSSKGDVSSTMEQVSITYEGKFLCSHTVTFGLITSRAWVSPDRRHNQWPVDPL
ncbi:hypothetical protein Gekk315_00062 [Aeromonas phage Gekk3-15]